MNRDNQQVTATELAWLAGLWDGEGWFSLNINHRKNPKLIERYGNRNGVQISIGVSNSDYSIINAVQKILDILDITYHIYNRGLSGIARYVGQNERLELTITKQKSAYQICLAIIPYLIGKKDRAEIIKRFIEKRMKLIESGKRHKLDEDDWNLVEEIRELNAKTSGRNLNDYTTEIPKKEL